MKLNNKKIIQLRNGWRTETGVFQRMEFQCPTDILKCSGSQAIGEMQISTRGFTSAVMTVARTWGNRPSGPLLLGMSTTASSRKGSLEIAQKAETRRTIWPSLPPPQNSPKQTAISIWNNHTSTFTAAKIWNDLIWLSTDDYIRKTRYKYIL